MKNSYDQLNIEYVETKKASSFVKYTTIVLILIFVSIPLSQINPDFKRCVTVYTGGCLGIMPTPKCFCF